MGVISYQLMDQINGEDHNTYTLSYDDKVPNVSCDRERERERSIKGWGTPTFIAHTELEPKYLQNDTLLFRINKVERSDNYLH